MFILKILISMLILTILIYKLDYRTFLENLKQFPFIIIILFIISYVITVLTNALSFFILLKNETKQINFIKFLKLYWFSFSIGQFSPARSGELSIIAFLKKKYDIPVGVSSATFIMHKMSSLIMLLIFSFVVLLLYFKALYNLQLILLGLIIILICFIFLIKNYKLRFFIRKFILRKHAYLMEGFNSQFRAILKMKSILALSIVINAIRIILGGIIISISLYFFSFKAPLLLTTGINSISLLLSFIPISFSGIGVKETAGVVLFNYLGYPPSIVAAILIMITAIFLILNFIVFIYFIYGKTNHMYISMNFIKQIKKLNK